MNSVVKALVPKLVEGAKVIDLCVEGDKLLEEGTGAVYNKAVKGVKVPKGEFISCVADVIIPDEVYCIEQVSPSPLASL